MRNLDAELLSVPRKTKTETCSLVEVYVPVTLTLHIFPHNLFHVSQLFIVGGMPAPGKGML
jgi:hypothetical protein